MSDDTEAALLANKMLAAAGSQSPIILMKALLLCIRLVYATTIGEEPDRAKELE
jgi:hypothetical protein